MNKERILAIADAIEKEPKNFDMGIYHCGSTACIAGHAVILFGRPKVKYDGIDWFTDGQKLLDLTEEEASELFLGEELEYKANNLAFHYIMERETGVPAALRWMVENDKIDWKDALDA